MSTHGYNMPDGPAPAPPPFPPGADHGPDPSGPGAYPALPHHRTDPTAVGARRSLAWLIDAVIFLVLVLTFSAVGPFGRYESEANLAEAGYTLDNGCEAIEESTGTSQCFSAPGGVPFLEDDRLYFIDNGYLLLGAAAWLAYFVLVYVAIQGVTGATAGKYVMGIRVVDDLGQPPGMGPSLTRSVLWVIDGTPWIIPGLVAFVVSLISVGHRRIGDMAANTFVVRVADTGRPLQVPGYAPPTAPEYHMPERPRPAMGGTGGEQVVPGAEPSPLGQALGEISQTQGEPGPPTLNVPGQPGPEPARPDGPQQTVPLAGPGPASPVPREAPGTEAGTAGAPPGTAPADGAPAETSPADSAVQSPSPGPAPTVQSSPLVPPSPDPAAPPTLQPSSEEVMAALEASAGTPEPENATQLEGRSEPDDEPVSERVAEQPQSSQVPATSPPAPTSPNSTAPKDPSAPPPAAPTQPPPPPPAYPPQWDPGRGAYIQWDPGRGRWLQWDATTERWHAI